MWIYSNNFFKISFIYFKIKKSKDPCDTEFCNKNGQCDTATGDCKCNASYYGKKCETGNYFK